MSGQFLIGFVVSIVNIVIHALVMTVVVQMVRTIGANVNNPKWPAVLLSAVMVVTVLILMAAHTSEVIVWSLAYEIVDAASTGTDLVYFAFVNYTTLGYGDITHVKSWQLLGPITAMNGLLLFGWSTAVIFEVLRRAMVRINLVGIT